MNKIFSKNKYINQNLRLNIKCLTLLFTFVVTFLIVTSSIASTTILVHPQIVNPATNFSEILQWIDSSSFLNDIKTYVRYFSSLGSRVTGQYGYELATKYIADKFQEYGLKPLGTNGYYDFYNVTVPIDKHVRIEIPGSNVTINAYALWPNNIYSCYTPPGGLEGTLIYFKEGSYVEISQILKEFKLHDLSNVVALMPFNTQNSWLNLVNFKVRAVIFIDSGPNTNRIEAETKFTLTPLLIPRIYIRYNDSKVLMENIFRIVRIYSDMKYETIQAKNVLGVIEGSTFKNDVIVVSSHFDSWSVVPRLSPGADESTGVAVMLELAKYFSVHKPLRTIWFVAFSGHWEALSGARYFVEKYYFSPEVQNGTKKIWIHFNLDFSTDSNTVTWLSYGSMWCDNKYSTFFPGLFTAIRADISNSLTNSGFNVSKYVDDPSTPFLLTYLMSDSEPSVVAGVAGLTFSTSRSMRMNQETPYDTEDKVLYENLVPQAKFASACIYYFANIKELPLEWSRDRVMPERRYMASGGSRDAKGYAGIYGDVTKYDPNTRWYTHEGFENYDVIIDVVLAPSHYLPWAHIIVKLDSKSLSFRIPGIGADYIFPEAGYGAHYVGEQVGEPGMPAVRVYAYALNKTTGKIEWAPDFGIWSWPQNKGFVPDMDWRDVRVSLFRAEPVILTNVIDPYSFEEPWVNPNWHVSGFDRFLGSNAVSDTPTRYIPSISFEPRDFLTHATFLQWGVLTPSETGEPFVVIFVPPNSTFEVLLKDSAGAISGVLINASRENMEGVGFKVRDDQNLQISIPTQVANDLYWLNTKRFGILSTYRSYSMWAQTTYTTEEDYYKNMTKSLRDREYSLSLGFSLMSWSWGIKAYRELSSLISGLTYTFVFFSILLLPFTFLIEKLIFHSEGFKRLMLLVVIYIISWTVLSFWHPGFYIALSTPLAVIAFIEFLFSAVTLVMISGVTGSYLQEVRKKVIGYHFAEISRSGAVLMATSLGVEQMRKRALRTILSLTTVGVVAFSLVLLTSATGNIVSRGEATYSGASYDGLLINNQLGLSSIGRSSVDVIASLLYGTNYSIARRAWVYPPPFENQDPSERQYWVLEAKNKTANIYAIIGLEPSESRISNIDKVLISGRWFLPEDWQVCIIPKSVASELNLKLNSIVKLMGLEFKVVGILDDSKLKSLKDLDGAIISPIDFVQVRVALAGTPITPEVMKLMSLSYRVDYSYLIFLPYNFVSKVLYAPINSIVVSGPQRNLVSIAQEISLTQYQIASFLGNVRENKTRLFSTSFAIVTKGWDIATIPVIIASLMILDIMLGSVYERMKELSILSAIGLSPIHISGLLIIEAILYGVVGTILGYIPGIIGSRLLLELGMLPQGFVPGFASVYILVVTGVILAMVLAGTAYPIWKASTIVTPGLIRKFRFVTKEQSRVLNVPLPFFATEKEVYAVLDFISEYLTSCKVEGLAPFIVLTDPRYVYKTSEFTRKIILETKLLLPPYDANITQLMQLIAQVEVGVERYEFLLHVELLTGSIENWRKSVNTSIETLRKQLLLWRTLTDKEKEKYLNQTSLIKRKITGEIT
ncbi:MAG: M28 family peptidase [Thermoproteota archaeon]